MNKIILFVTTAVVLISASFLPLKTASAATYYSDIPAHHRAFTEISYLAQSGITTSDSSTKFSPDTYMTRAHAAMMIGKAIQMNGDQGPTRFSDVSSGHIASGYINEAVSRKIINGYSNGTFKPDQTLKRGEMASLIARAFGYRSTTVTDAARELMDKGISKGTGKGAFGTEDLMKRGDFSVFLARAVNAEFRVGATPMPSTSMYVNVDESTSLNMRKGPSTAYVTTKQLFAGYQIGALYQVGEWAYVKVGNDYGFLHSAFLSSTQPSVSNVKDPIDLIEPAPSEKPSVGGKKPLDQVVVIIDPGHGGKDPGGAGFGLSEKNIVLDTSLRIKKYFEQTPIKVKLTRETDVFVELADRVRFASKNNGDTFISVHTNAFNGKASGLETYYYKAAKNPNVVQSIKLATYIQNRMLQAWALPNRKVQNKSLHVTRENTMPATLLEIGFIDNKVDNAYLASPSHREKMAKAIFLGTLDYYYHYEGRTEVAPLYTKFNATPSSK